MKLFEWMEEEFLKRTEGSPIRRIGIDGWQRDNAEALGKALRQSADLRAALLHHVEHTSALVRAHVARAMATSNS